MAILRRPNISIYQPVILPSYKVQIERLTAMRLRPLSLNTTLALAGFNFTIMSYFEIFKKKLVEVTLIFTPFKNLLLTIKDIFLNPFSAPFK